MNKIAKWFTGCLIACFIGFIGCGNIEDAESEVKSIELLRTSQSWNEVDLPDYPEGKPELVAVKYIIPPGKKLGWHHHVAMNHGVLVQGELTIIAQDGKTKVMRAGDVYWKWLMPFIVGRTEAQNLWCFTCSICHKRI